MSDWYRGDDGELIEVRRLDIPGMPPDEIDEIICGPLHLETLDSQHAYMRVAGLMVNFWARDGWLSITCEPDGIERIEGPGAALDTHAHRYDHHNDALW